MKDTAAFAETRDGTKIKYELHAGPVGSPRVALIHSLAMDGPFWSPVVSRLKEQATVLTYDCRGHGGSEKSQAAYTVALFADDLADLLDHVGWEKAVVCGASMGGSVALAFAIRYPQRTQALGLLDTTAWYGETAAKDWEERAQRAAEKGFASLVDFQRTRWFSDSFREAEGETVQRCVDTFLRNDVDAYMKTCQMLGAMDLRGGLESLRVPTKILVGEEDYATPISMSQDMQRVIPGAELHILPKARHLTVLEKPDRIASEVARLAGVAS